MSISPSGTKVLFGSDWIGIDDGHSADYYVVELPIYQELLGITKQEEKKKAMIYPNPLTTSSTLTFNNPENNYFNFFIYNSKGQIIKTIKNINTDQFIINKNDLSNGIYLYKLVSLDSSQVIDGKLVIK